MRLLPLLVFAAACAPPADDKADPTDTDTDAQTDAQTDAPTDAQDQATDSTDEDPGPLPPSFVIPPGNAQGGDNWQLFGYKRAQAVVRLWPELAGRRANITGIRLRRTQVNADDLATTLSIPNAQVWLDTLDGFESSDLSDTFADNLTGAAQKIFDGTLDIAAADAVGLAYDDLVLTVDPPFPYDPANGGLLIDFNFPESPGTVRFDCKNDATVFMKMLNFNGDPGVSDNYTGCGYSFEILVSEPAE
jgi:hypothetical protein